MADFNPSNDADLLLAINDDVQRALANLSPEGWGRQPRPEHWSAAEIVGHMIEFEPHWARVAARVTEGSRTRIGRSADDPTRLAGPQGGLELSPEEALERLTAAGNEAADILRAIPPEDGQRSGEREGGGTMSVEQIVQQFLIAHAREHARQLLETLEPA